MKFKQLKEIVAQHLDDPTRDDSEVAIPYNRLQTEGTIGYSKVSGVRFGDSWHDCGYFFLVPTRSLVEKTENQKVFDEARDLLMLIATKASKKVTYEQETARKILKNFGYTDQYFENTTTHLVKEKKKVKK